jgi:hypothetical protein
MEGRFVGSPIWINSKSYRNPFYPLNSLNKKKQHIAVLLYCSLAKNRTWIKSLGNSHSIR